MSLQVNEVQERLFVFMKAANGTLTTIGSDGDIIIAGTPVPRGFKGRVEDFNVNFDTAAGTVKLVILGPSGDIQNDVLKNISSDTSGIGATVLDAGESLGLVIQTNNASGVFGCYFSGVIRKEPEIR